MSVRTSVVEGLTFIKSNPGLLGLMVLLATMGFVMLGPVFVLVPEIAREDLGQEATGAAILFAITSLGMLVMSIVLASMSNLRRKGAVLLVTLMIGGIMVNLNQTLAQSHTPDEMMGRVMSVVALAIAGMMPLGSLVAGAGAELTGAGVWLVICGVAMIVIGALLWVRLPALREME